MSVSQLFSSHFARKTDELFLPLFSAKQAGFDGKAHEAQIFLRKNSFYGLFPPNKQAISYNHMLSQQRPNHSRPRITASHALLLEPMA